MKWCCAAFEGHFQGAGLRGFAVFVATEPGADPMFILQHRAIEPGQSPPLDYGAPLSIVSDVGIQFCPWCGVRLEEWYRDWINELARSDLRVSF
jgi:hypothetical protein